MKRIYRLGAVVLVLLATTSFASAFTEIGDNITVANNVTAQNFLGNLNWAYLLGIPADFPNSTVSGYNGNFPNNTLADYGNNFPNSTISGYNNNFPNASLPNYLLISTYSGNFPNSSLINYLPIATYDGNFPNSTVAGYGSNFPNTSLPNYLLINTYSGNFPNSTLAGYGSNFPNTSLPNYLLINTYSGNFPNSTIAGYGSNFPNTSLSNYLLISSYNGDFPNSTISTKTTLAQVNSSAQIGESQVTNLVTDLSGKEPTITGSTSNTFWNGLKQFVTLSSGLITDFSAAVRSNISSSSGLVSYNSSTGVISDTINQSANLYNVNGSNITTGTIPAARYMDAVNSSALLGSITQVTGLQGILTLLINAKANKTNIGEFTGGQLSSTAMLPAGTIILIDANETDSPDLTSTSTSAETRLMTFNLPANSYTTIIVEAEVSARQNVQKALAANFRWRFNESTTIRKEFTWGLTNINTLGSQGIGNSTIKTSFPGGQGVTTTLNLTGQITSNPGLISVTMDARSFRVYGVI